MRELHKQAPDIAGRVLRMVEDRLQQRRSPKLAQKQPPEIEPELLQALERRWYHAHQTHRPADNQPTAHPPHQDPVPTA